MSQKELENLVTSFVLQKSQKNGTKIQVVGVIKEAEFQVVAEETMHVFQKNNKHKHKKWY